MVKAFTLYNGYTVIIVLKETSVAEAESSWIMRDRDESQEEDMATWDDPGCTAIPHA